MYAWHQMCKNLWQKTAETVLVKNSLLYQVSALIELKKYINLFHCNGLMRIDLLKFLFEFILFLTVNSLNEMKMVTFQNTLYTWLFGDNLYFVNKEKFHDQNWNLSKLLSEILILVFSLSV